MFKNVIPYRIEQWTQPTAASVVDRLEAARFVECGASQPESAGWVEPRGQNHGVLLESVAGQWILQLGFESKSVPAGIVKTQLGVLLDQAEKETGRRPRGKQARELKDDIVHGLLPRAFPKRSDTLLWIDADAKLLWVATGSTRGAERVVTELLQALGGDLRPILLQTALSPAVAMAAWLSDKQAPAGFTIDRDCELKQPDSDKSVVRYARHTLDIDEVGEHIRQGKLPTQLALTWRGRVSFVLTEALALKKIQLLDLALEGAGMASAAGGDDAGGFDADVAIVTGELQQLLPDLIEALGGLAEVGPSAVAPSAPPSAVTTTATTTETATGLAPWDERP